MGMVTLEGPFPVSAISIVDQGIGVYCFSRGRARVNYVGRSDSDLRSRMMRSFADGTPTYTHFWFGYETSPMRAYQAECWLYHDHRPSDNMVHPAVPRGAIWRCPVPSCEWG